MTYEPNRIPAETEQLLDKLVDGELDDSRRRKLLMELDAQPDGWRRCAMAFLEAQAWKSTLGSLVQAPRQNAAPRPASPTSWRSMPWGTILAAAASFLMAFGLGTVWRGQALRPAAEQVAESAKPSHNSSSSPVNPLERPEWGTVTVPVDRDSDGQAESLDLPVARGPGIDEQWVRNQPTPIPQEVFRALESMGHKVQQQRQYYPFELRDGQRVLVPVDEVDVRYVGERRFQ